MLTLFVVGIRFNQAVAETRYDYMFQPTVEEDPHFIAQHRVFPGAVHDRDESDRDYDPTRKIVNYSQSFRPGTIVVNTRQRYLYYVLDHHTALRYGIGVARPGFEWKGTHTISAKREWPDWVPPEQMLKRQPYLPRHMEGGLRNPLGARALYIGGTIYRIHGSNQPQTIGQRVSSGCIRMSNADVMHLYDRVKVGSPVVVL